MREESQPLPVCAGREWLRELSVDWPESQRQQLASLLQRLARELVPPPAG
jgi:hypothetical protein